MTRERVEEFCWTRKDFDLDWFSGTGAGGQYRNKTQNSLRLRHIPSGIVATAADNRERSANLRNAFARMRPRLLAWVRAQMGEREYPRSNEVIRTYHEPDNYVVDHASGERIAWSEMDKHIGDLIEARARSDRRVSAQSGRVSR